MAYRLETPSRIWARIEEAQDEELPSLPSMPAYEDSAQNSFIVYSYPRPAKIRAMSTPLSAGETTARPPLGRSGSSLARSRDTLPDEYLPPLDKDDEEISTSLTDALETDSRSGSPDEFDDNQSRASAPYRSIKDIYNNSVTSLRENLTSNPRLVLDTDASPVSYPDSDSSPRSVTSASSQHTPTIQRLPLSPSQYGSSSDRSRHSASGSRPRSRAASRMAQELENERIFHTIRYPRNATTKNRYLVQRRSHRADLALALVPGHLSTQLPPQRNRDSSFSCVDISRRTLTASPTPTPTSSNAYPLPFLKLLVTGSVALLMQVINSAARPTLRPKPTPFTRGKFQTPAARRLSEALAIDNGVGSSSFVSTASSHDLAIHRRANASFDAIAHARGGSGGDFDQRKLRIYLQSLNKHLSDENTACRDDIAMLKRAYLEEDPGEPRDQQVEIVEDTSDELVNALKNLEAARSETEAMRVELEAAQEDATAAREEVVKVTDQCNAQMADLETDVQKVIQKLEDRLNEREAEAAQLRERLIDRSRDVYHEHAEELELERQHASKLEAEVTQLTGELAIANGESRNLKAELRDLKLR
ncbi:hypothetical protein RHS01_03327 [Rhizoctonia solani]|uniref:Uncharacterized protein n=1 Tax=Rhizoctonia solani TaxID=456999 RepID=A0A8H7IGR9_9AGAM|nr:hypothetical protein RHS01_03327 [Rhizoctonia solani]